MEVVLLYNPVGPDAPPDDLDTLVQVREVAEGLEKAGYTVREVQFDLDLNRTIGGIGSPDLVFNLVETIEGRSTMQLIAPLLLEQLGVPFTGAGSRELAITTDKLYTKQILHGAGLPTAPWFPNHLTPGKLPPRPLIMKPVSEEGSVGVDDDNPFFSGQSADELAAELAARAGRGIGPWFAEQFIDGREMQIGFLDLQDGTGLQPLSPCEIPFDSYPEGQPRIYGYRAKWVEGSHEWETVIPTFELRPDDGPLVQTITELGTRALESLGITTYARVDFRINAAGQPWILEVNVNPCLSQEAMFFWAAEQIGLDDAALMGRIVEATLSRAKRLGR